MRKASVIIRVEGKIAKLGHVTNHILSIRLRKYDKSGGLYLFGTSEGVKLSSLIYDGKSAFFRAYCRAIKRSRKTIKRQSNAAVEQQSNYQSNITQNFDV
eukprot:TCONS_00072299-protein